MGVGLVGGRKEVDDVSASLAEVAGGVAGDVVGEAVANMASEEVLSEAGGFGSEAASMVPESLALDQLAAELGGEAGCQTVDVVEHKTGFEDKAGADDLKAMSAEPSAMLQAARPPQIAMDALETSVLETAGASNRTAVEEVSQSFGAMLGGSEAQARASRAACDSNESR